MNDHKWGLAAVAGQFSLSFQLFGVGRGLYNFGRRLCLLSTVTGLRIPPHNFIAVNNVKLNPLCCQYWRHWALFLTLKPVCLFFFSCGDMQTNYSFHMEKRSRLFHMSVPSLVCLLPWENSDKPRLKVSLVKYLCTYYSYKILIEFITL